MNELDIIRQQLDTERLHVAAVVSNDSPSGAHLDYLEFALRRLESGPSHDVLSRLETARHASGTERSARWKEVLQYFNREWQHHLTQLEAANARRFTITQWRALARVDADSILEERRLYEKVTATPR